MNKKISPTLIGAFVVGALSLVVIAVLAFGSGQLFRHTKEFVLYFDSSVNGLRIGAPVKFRGVEIGSVKNILLQLEKNMKVQRIPVIIEIDLEKVTRRGASGSALKDPKAAQELLDQGLRGQLQMESRVTGLLYSGLALFPGTPANFVQPPGSKYPEIPTLPTSLENAEDAATRILAKLDEIDFKRLMQSVTQTVNGVNTLLNSPALRSTLQSLSQTMPKVDEAVASIREVATTIDGTVKTLSGDVQQTSETARHAIEQMEGTVKQAEATLASVRAAVDSDSPTFYELTRSLREVSGAARSLRLLANSLERNPRALIFGRPENLDGR